jgi:hypothetical protein
MSIFSKIVRGEFVATEAISDLIEFNNGEIPLEVSNIDINVINEFNKHKDLLKALDDWVLVPDMKLLSSLKKLAELVKEIHSDNIVFKESFKVYRGFDLNSKYQDTMGLSKKGVLFNEIKPFPLNHVFSYDNDKTPLSFTTVLDPVAKTFGPTIVETELHCNEDNFLFISDELCYLVATMRNHAKMFTQKEIILLPPFNKQFKVIQK